MKYAIIASNRQLQSIHGLYNKLLTKIAPEDSIDLWIIATEGEQFEGFCDDHQWIFQHVHFLSIAEYGWQEARLDALTDFFQQNIVDALFFMQNMEMTELAIRLSIRLKGSYAINIQDILLHDQYIEVQKEIFDGRRLWKEQHQDKPYCIVMKPPINENIQAASLSSKPIVHFHHFPKIASQMLENYCFMRVKNNQGLQDAERILLVGQGVGSAEAVAQLQIWAKQQKMQLGVTRAVVLNGWASMDLLIGASGQVVSPKLCLAVGVSGAAPLFYGIQNASYIIAINTDANAPIIEKADLSIIHDWKILLQPYET